MEKPPRQGLPGRPVRLLVKKGNKKLRVFAGVIYGREPVERGGPISDIHVPPMF